MLNITFNQYVSKKMSLLSLDKNTTNIISSFLDLESKCKLRRTCKKMHKIIILSKNDVLFINYCNIQLQIFDLKLKRNDMKSKIIENRENCTDCLDRLMLHTGELYECYSCEKKFCEDHMRYLNVSMSEFVHRKYAHQDKYKKLVNVCSDECYYDASRYLY